MKTGTIVALIIGGIFLLFSLVSCGSVVSFNNGCVSHEAGIKAQYKVNQSNYSSYFAKIKEMAQVPEMYTDDLQKVYAGAMKGRYGEDGSRAMFSFIQEHNPNFDSSMYTQLQRAMEAGRDSFHADQKMLLDKKRVYEEMLQQFPGSMIAGFLGFPKIDLDEYDIVIDDTTAEAFRTKRAAPIQFRE